MTTRNWTTENISDQTGNVAIVTGSSSGIGYEAVRVLANKNAMVIIAVRNTEKGIKAADKIRSQNKSANVQVMELDLADLASVAAFADAFKKSHSRLDLLINNAGVMIPPYSKTKDGFELQFGTNHLGHFALTAQLLDLLNKTVSARIVNVSSNAHKVGKINFDDLTWEKRGYSPWRAYGVSKIANLYFTYELDLRLKAAGHKTIANAAHPGWTATELQRNMSFANIANRLFAQDITMGALPTLRGAFDLESKGGDYFGPNGFMEMRGFPVKAQSNELSHDETIATRLWKASEDLTGEKFGLDVKALGAGK